MLYGSTLFANAPLASFFQRVGQHCEIVRGDDHVEKSATKIVKSAKKITLQTNLFAPKASAFTPKKDNC